MFSTVWKGIGERDGAQVICVRVIYVFLKRETMEEDADLKGPQDLPESQRKEFSGQVDLQGHNPPPHPSKHFPMG